MTRSPMNPAPAHTGSRSTRLLGAAVLVGLVVLVLLGFFGAPVEHLHLGCDNFREITYLIILLVAVGLQAPLNEHQATLAQVLLANLTQAAPGFDVEPVGCLFCISFACLPAPTDCDTEGAYFAAVRRGAYLWVSTQIADELDAV